MIDLYSGDKTFILSTLDFVCDLSIKHNAPPSITSYVIEDHGTRAMAVLFDGNSTDSLASLHYSIYSKKKCYRQIICYPKTSASNWVLNQIPLPKSLIPDHILDWKGRWDGHSGLGWKLVDNRFLPVMTSKTAAQECLLQIIHCNCTTACRTQR